ncbi:hypothetical protein FV113G1_19970 [Fusobacterium varium]|nr:hypothetical protein FV113G1_19970 [Fusobacterium varium]
MKVLNGFDFTLNELKNAVLEKLLSIPSRGIEGQIFYNTETKKINIHNGTAFVEVGEPKIATTSTPGTVIVGNGLKINDSGILDLAILNQANIINSEYLPSYVDDVLEFDSRNSFPAAGEQGKIYVAIDTSTIYRWSGQAYIGISNPLDYATQAEAEIGKDNTKVMTPLRVKEAILSNTTKKFTATIGDGQRTEFVIDHPLNTKDILINLYEGDELVIADIAITSPNSIKITFSQPPEQDSIKIVIAG